jgi:hypothetical protein
MHRSSENLPARPIVRIASYIVGRPPTNVVSKSSARLSSRCICDRRSGTLLVGCMRTFGANLGEVHR